LPDLGPLSNTINDVHKRLLPHLAKLPELPFLTPQHLAVWPSSVSSLSEFEPWSHLHVVSNVQSGCDFSCLTQIMSLQLQQASNKAVVKLPQGESVALKTLNMNTHCRVGCCLRSDSRCHALPEEWQSYTGLIQFPFIQLPPVEALLPGWLSKLQKLESLEMAGAIFDAFPRCLSQLFGIKGTA